VSFVHGLELLVALSARETWTVAAADDVRFTPGITEQTERSHSPRTVIVWTIYYNESS
jgi:hypothetical protein